MVDCFAVPVTPADSHALPWNAWSDNLWCPCSVYHLLLGKIFLFMVVDLLIACSLSMVTHCLTTTLAWMRSFRYWCASRRLSLIAV